MTGTDAAAAADIARKVFGEAVTSVERFTTGAMNWVYDVTTASGEHVVVRIVRRAEDCAGGVLWSQTLRPLGVPLPRLIAHHVPPDGATGERGWMVLERLPGKDLEHVYPSLSPAQKRLILDHVMRAQEIAAALPRGDRYGFSRGPNPPPHASWLEVLQEHLDRSRRWIEQVGAVDPRWAGRVGRLVGAEDFSSVAPIPFIDDTTERNVIIDDGVFQGIVDVDGISCGDPLFVPALTRMALLKQGGDTLYTEEWIDRLRLPPSCRRHFEIYTALFALNFLAELGQQFNQDAPPPVDPAEVRRLEGILDMLLRRL